MVALSFSGRRLRKSKKPVRRNTPLVIHGVSDPRRHQQPRQSQGEVPEISSEVKTSSRVVAAVA
jgi:hypothetical protein